GWKWSRRHPALLTGAAVALVFGVIALVFGVRAYVAAQYSEKLKVSLEETESQRTEANRQRQIAEKERTEADQQRQVAEDRRTEANQQRQIAEKERTEADRQRQIAVDKGMELEALEQYVRYERDMKTAHQAWQLGGAGVAVDLLKGHLPREGARDL